jgi:potassium-dependent mechanosensitive channel
MVMQKRSVKQVMPCKVALFFLIFFCGVFCMEQASYAESIMTPQYCRQQLDNETEKRQHLKESNAIARHQIEKLLLEKENLQQTLTPSTVSTALLEKISLDRAIARANLDGAMLAQADGIQLLNSTGSTISRLATELRNTTLAAGKTPAVRQQLMELQKQVIFYRQVQKIQQLELDELSKAKEYAEQVYQIQTENKTYIEQLYQQGRQQERQQVLLKKEQELVNQQAHWRGQLQKTQEAISMVDEKNTEQREQLQIKLFEAQEKSNLLHLELLLARLKSQFSTLREHADDDRSVTALNQQNQQLWGFIAQIDSLSDLVKRKSDLITVRLDLGKTSRQNNMIPVATYQFNKSLLKELFNDFQLISTQIQTLKEEVSHFQTILQQNLSQALARRQGLPGFSLSAWTNLAQQLMQMPTLFLPVLRALGEQVVIGYERVNYWRITNLLLLEVVWFWMLFELRTVLAVSLQHVPKQRRTMGQNSLFVFLQLLYNNIIGLFVFVGLGTLLFFIGVSIRSFTPILYLILVWFVFKLAMGLARCTLLESTTDVSGRDVRLYHNLKWVLLVGGILTMFTVLAHQLPVDYEVSDFFNRLFMLFLLATGFLLLRGWRIVPALLEPYIDESRPYLIRALRLLSFLIPVSVISIGGIGFFGYVDFAWRLGVYEGIFLLVMTTYILVRGVLIDVMEWLSELFIRRLRHGWLWTQALLRPLDKLIRILLFVIAVVSLFMLYGWDQESYVGKKVYALFHVHLVAFQETDSIITPLGIIEFIIVIVLLVWAARWTREFSYRWVFDKTRDLGLRNSLAAFTQYTTVIIGTMIALKVIGVDLTTLNYILTALAIGIGFGLRDIAKNYVCGFLLLIERPVRVGDLVSISTFEGEVTYIGMRAMIVKTWDNMEVLVPNSAAFENPFTNWTHQDSVIRTVLTIKISRHDDPNTLRQIIIDVLECVPEVMTDPEPQIFLSDMSEALMEFNIRYFINLQLGYSRPEIRSKVLFALWQSLQKHGMKLPYQPQDIYLREVIKIHEGVS